MKFVTVNWDPEFRGFNIDPHSYKVELGDLLGLMPSGAREFVAEPGHFSFNSLKCVKDLQLSEISTPVKKSDSMSIKFLPNQWKHEQGLQIRYFNVTRFEFELKRQHDWMADEAVLMDEVLPHEVGCSHEIALTDSWIYVECEDLRATWN